MNEDYEDWGIRGELKRKDKVDKEELGIRGERKKKKESR